MEGNVDPDLKKALFASDFKKYLPALAILDETLVNAQDDMLQRFLANADLILKYMTIRFFDTNTTVTIKLFDILEHLIKAMERANSSMSDYEAFILMPIFMIKVAFVPFHFFFFSNQDACPQTGDNKEAIRARVREILKQICSVYPASKLFNYLMEGLKSKNSRTRSECLEEMAHLIQRHGISVCQSAKVFPLVGKQISDRDNGVRTAALSVLANAYSFVGTAIFKQIGELPQKDRTMLDERLKRVTINAAQQPASVPAVVAAPTTVPAAAAAPHVTTIPAAAAAAAKSEPAEVAASNPIQYSHVSAPGQFKLELDKLDVPASMSIPMTLPPPVTSAGGAVRITGTTCHFAQCTVCRTLSQRRLPLP